MYHPKYRHHETVRHSCDPPQEHPAWMNGFASQHQLRFSKVWEKVGAGATDLHERAKFNSRE
jgi:hypothetical protein